MPALAVAGGNSYQGVAVPVRRDDLANNAGAARLVNVEQQNRARRAAVRVGNGAQAGFDGRGLALGVVGVDHAAHSAGLVHIAVGADAGLQLIGPVAQHHDDLIGAGLAQGDYLVHDEGVTLPVQQGFQSAHAPGHAGGEENGGGEGAHSGGGMVRQAHRERGGRNGFTMALTDHRRW